MEACLLISLWMGQTVNPPVYRCFRTEVMAQDWVRDVNRRGRPFNEEWLAMYVTRRELVRIAPAAMQVPEG